MQIMGETSKLWLLGLAAALSACGPSAPAKVDKVTKGEYLVTVMACSDCHTPGAMMGKPDMARKYAGGDVGFEMPELGTFYPPNLTNDKDTGLGNWSEEEIVTALRKGTRPDGRQLAPVMPWMALSGLTDEDAQAIAAYLKTLPGIANRVPGPFGANETPTAPFQRVVFPAAEAPAESPATPAQPPK